MRSVSLGELTTLHYGKSLQGYHNRNPKDARYCVFGTNGPIGWNIKPLFYGPSIIVGRKGAYREVFWAQNDSWVIDTAYYLSLNRDDIDLKWLYYNLKTINVNRLDSGSAIPSTKREDFYSIRIKFPNKNTQYRIADMLSAYDDLIENNKRRIALLEESARQLYKEWFVRFRFPGHEHVEIIDGVPEGWQRETIADIAETVGGGTPSTNVPQYWEDGKITWFVPKDLTQNRSLVLLDSEKKITEQGLQKSSAKMLPPETILMSIRASIRYFGIFDGRPVLIKGLFRLSQRLIHRGCTSSTI